MYDIHEIIDEVTSDLIGQVSKFILDLKEILPHDEWIIVVLEYQNRFNIDLLKK